MALLKAVQCFSCSGVSFSSVLMRSIYASLLATICSAVNWGSAACAAGWAALPFAVFAPLAGLACFASGWVGSCGIVAETPDPPAEDTHHSADSAAQHTAHRSGRLVAGLRSLLDAFD